MELEGVKELKMKWMRMLFEEEEELEWMNMRMRMDWFGMELEGEWMMWMELMEGWEWMWIERASLAPYWLPTRKFKKANQAINF